MKLAGACSFAGVVIGLLLAIAYDTSANTAALEGARRHLTFAQIGFVAVGGAIAGLFLAMLITIARAFYGPAR